MEHLLLNPDVLRLAKLTPDAAKDQFFEADDDGWLKLKDDAVGSFVVAVQQRMEQERNDKLGQGKKSLAKDIEQVIAPIFRRFGVESPGDVMKGINDLSAKIELAGTEKSAPATLTDDEVTRLPAFQRRLDQELQAINAEKARIQSEHEALVSSIQQQKKDGYILTKVESVLSSAKAAFGQNRNAQLQYFFNSLDRSALHLNEDGAIELLDKDGNPLRDTKTKAPIQFHEYVLGKWTELNYGFNDTEATNTPAIPGKPRTGVASNIATLAQAEAALSRAKNPTEKQAILERMAELI